MDETGEVDAYGIKSWLPRRSAATNSSGVSYSSTTSENASSSGRRRATTGFPVARYS